MAPVLKRVQMSATDSTSSIGTGGAQAVAHREQPAQGAGRGGQLVDLAGVVLEDVVLLGAGGVLQREDGLRVEQVQLALAAPLVLPADVEPPVLR